MPRASSSNCATVPGVRDLDSSYEAGKPEVRVPHQPRQGRRPQRERGLDRHRPAHAGRRRSAGHHLPRRRRPLRRAASRREGVPRSSRRPRPPLRALRHARQRAGLECRHARGRQRPHADRPLQPPAPDHDHRQPRRRASRSATCIPFLNQTVAGLNMPAEYRSGLLGRSKEFGRAVARLRLRRSCSRSCSCTWCSPRSSRASSTPSPS